MSDDKIKELLAVLNETKYPYQQEHKQCKLLIDYGLCGVSSVKGTGFVRDISSSAEPLYEWDDKRLLADLAFRLRDEVSLELWEQAAWIMEAWLAFPKERWNIKWILRHAQSRYHDPEMTASFLQQRGKPIHWIIAALIAKELAKNGK